MVKTSGQLSVSTSSASTSCIRAAFLPTTSPPFGGDKREEAGVENYFFNSLLRSGVDPAGADGGNFRRMASTPYQRMRRPPRNYAQLNLFAGRPADLTTAAEKPAALEPEAPDARLEPIGPDDSQALADASPEDAGRCDRRAGSLHACAHLDVSLYVRVAARRIAQAKWGNGSGKSLKKPATCRAGA